MGINYDDNLGKRFQKPDIERLGIFVEMPYLVGMRYSFPKTNYRNGPTFLPSGRKTKCGTQHGYFNETFMRIFEGDVLKKKKRKTKDATPFILGYQGKKHSTPGDDYGTFTDKHEAFSAVLKKRSAYVHEPPNFITSNPKKGNSGYVGIYFNKIPEHMPEPYKSKKQQKVYGHQIGDRPLVPVHYPKPFFDPNPFHEDRNASIYVQTPERQHKLENATFIPNGPAKWQGGSHAGCFHPFPTFMPCKYVSMADANKPKPGHGEVFYPQSMGIKTMYSDSVLQRNTDYRINTKNYKKYEPVFVRRLLENIC